METGNTKDIEKIISNSKKELEQMPYYNSFNEQYKMLSKKFKDSLTNTQKNNFEELLKLFSTIKQYESYIAYRVGYEDGIKYKNSSKNDPKK